MATESAEVVSITGCDLCQTHASIAVCAICGRDVCGGCADAATMVLTGSVEYVCHECLAGDVALEQMGDD